MTHISSLLIVVIHTKPDLKIHRNRYYEISICAHNTTHTNSLLAMCSFIIYLPYYIFCASSFPNTEVAMDTTPVIE